MAFSVVTQKKPALGRKSNPGRSGEVWRSYHAKLATSATPASASLVVALHERATVAPLHLDDIVLGLRMAKGAALCIARRQVFTGGLSLAATGLAPIILTGCSTFKIGDAATIPHDCNSRSDLVDRSLCRQAALRSSTTGYVSLGMLIGGALGALAAPAIGINPFAGAAIGSIIGGGIAAIDLYVAYRLEQASGDAQRAFRDLQRDIAEDVSRSTLTLEDVALAQQELGKAFRDTSKHLAEQSRTIERVGLLVKEANLNKQTYLACPAIYTGAAQKLDGRMSSSDHQGTSTIGANGRSIEVHEREMKRYLKEIRPMGHLR